MEKEQINQTPAFTFKSWRESMGYSSKDAADELGVDEYLIDLWEKRPPEDTPKYIQLACNALALGIKV